MERFISYPEHKTIVFALDAPAISPEFQARAEDDGFKLKDEFHVTVFYRENFEQLGDNGYQEFVKRINELTTSPQYSFAAQIYHVSLDKVLDGVTYPRESLVVPVTSTDLETAIAQCSDHILGDNSFLHMTLFTKPENPPARTGIGIPSKAKWQTLKPVLYAEDWQA